MAPRPEIAEGIEIRLLLDQQALAQSRGAVLRKKKEMP